MKGVLDIDAFLAALGPPPKEASPNVVAQQKTDIGPSDLRRIARALKNSPKKKELGDALAKVVDGEPYAVKTTRHGITYRLVREILDRHPAADHERLAALFAPSLALMQPTHITLDVIVGMCDHKEPSAPKVDHTTRIAEAFNGSRAEPYAPEDVVEMAEAVGCRPDELMRRWLIQKGDSFYVLCDGVYRCYTSSDVGNAVLRDLAPAATVGVDLHEVTQRGMRRKTISELMELYGTVANDVIVDLAAQKAHYDPISRAFIEAPCPVRVTAKYDREVEQWLSLLVGPARAGKLNDWLASVTALSEPCAALYLEGAPGTGKSLLAHAVARIFSADRPTTLEEAMGSFNESLVGCPVVLADETVPTDHRGKIRTDAIREFVQARTRPLNRKYRPTATVRGSIRLVMAANNRNLLATVEHLTEHDISAFTERFLHLTVCEEAREYLRTKPVQQWMKDERISRHVMWLVENWEVTREGRFLVSGDATELTNALSTGTGLRADVCQWICGFLLRPSTFLNRFAAERLVVVEDGHLYLNPRAITAGWDEYSPDKFSVPKPMAVARALGGLSKEKFLRVPAGANGATKVMRMRDFDLKALALWGRETGHIEADGIRDALVRIEAEMSKTQGTVPVMPEQMGTVN